MGTKTQTGTMGLTSIATALASIVGKPATFDHSDTDWKRLSSKKHGVNCITAKIVEHDEAGLVAILGHTTGDATITVSVPELQATVGKKRLLKIAEKSGVDLGDLIT